MVSFHEVFIDECVCLKCSTGSYQSVDAESDQIRSDTCMSSSCEAGLLLSLQNSIPTKQKYEGHNNPPK